MAEEKYQWTNQKVVEVFQHIHSYRNKIVGIDMSSYGRDGMKHWNLKQEVDGCGIDYNSSEFALKCQKFLMSEYRYTSSINLIGPSAYEIVIYDMDGAVHLIMGGSTAHEAVGIGTWAIINAETHDYWKERGNK